MPLHPVIARALAAAQGAQPYWRLPIAQARAQARLAYLRDGDPVAVGEVRNLAMPGPAGPLAVRVYVPPGPGPHPLVVFFHGSGFVILDLDTHDDLCRRLCVGAGCVVASVDYRLAPEHRFPSAPDDCLAATRWIAAHAGEFSADARRMVLAGDSAGGCLAAVTCARLRDEGGPTASGQLLLYPVTDAPSTARDSYARFGTGHGLSTEGMQWFWQQYAGTAEIDRHPHAAPLQAASLRGLPPAYVMTAEFDVLRDEGEAYARRLLDEDIAVHSHRAASMNHGFLKYAGKLQEADTEVARACDWLQARW